MTRRQAIDMTLRLVRSPDARVSLTAQASHDAVRELLHEAGALARRQLRAIGKPVGLRVR